MPKGSIFACVAAVAGALLATSGRADAADATGKFAVKGAGGAACSTYVEARTRRLTDRLATFEGWLHGYLTAHNRLDQGTFDSVSWQGNSLLMGALEAYCKKNADQRFEIAVAGLINTLRSDRITEQSDMVQIKSGDRTILIYREVVLRLQKALIQRKLYTGKPDGRFGEDTRRAVEAFQKSQNLQTTGLPDQRTLLALLPSSAPAASTGSKPPAGGATPQRPTPRPQPSR